jgi:UDP-N-acetylglucosamine 3-dehydrogenase
MYRTAVVGTGIMGMNHARVLNEVSRLAAICDVNEGAGRAAAKRFSVPAYKSLQEMLGAQELDAVVISTPTVTHKELALAVIAAGKHVLVEKPLSDNVADARAMAQAAEKAGVTFAVGHIERYNPAVRYAQTAISRGQFGKVITASAKRVSSYPGRIGDVGVVVDLAIHDMDIIRYVTGSDVEAVFAAGGVQASGRHEDHADIMMMLYNGATGLVEVNWLTPMKIRKLSLTCSQRFVEVDYMNQTVDLSSSTAMDVDTSDLSQIPQEHDHRHITLKKQEPLKNELLDFLDAIEKKRKPLVGGEDGVEAVRMARAALESIKQRKVIEMGSFEGQ